MSDPDSIKRDLEFCDEHRELADLLIEHGCAPAGEDRDLLRALVAYVEQPERGGAVGCSCGADTIPGSVHAPNCDD